MMKPILASLALVVVCACKPAENPATKPAVDATPAIAAAAWLTGTWTGTHEGATVEESWSVPHGPSMIGSMRVIDEGKPAFYELIVLEDVEGGPFMRLANFRPGLQPTPKGTLTYRLASSTDRELLFEVVGADAVKRIRYAKNPNDPSAMSVKLERDDGVDELLFTRVR